jgi:hypothetical protein
MARASRDGRVNNNVGVEENAHGQEGKWRYRWKSRSGQGQGTGVAEREAEGMSDRGDKRPRDDERP